MSPTPRGPQRNRSMPGSRAYHFSDPDRKAAAHARKAIPKPEDDPPAIVPCPYCAESVVAARKRYWDSEGAHRHQPQGNPKYGVH